MPGAKYELTGQELALVKAAVADAPALTSEQIAVLRRVFTSDRVRQIKRVAAVDRFKVEAGSE